MSSTLFEKIINKGMAPTIGGIILILKNHIKRFMPPVLYLDILYAAGNANNNVNKAIKGWCYGRI